MLQNKGSFIGREKMIIIAHRGASAFTAGNSWNAFWGAVQDKADAIETDVRNCAFCNEIKLSHDPIKYEFHDEPVLLKEFLRLGEALTLHLELKEKGLIKKIFRLVKETSVSCIIIYSSFKWFELFKIRLLDSRARIGFLWGSDKKISKRIVSFVAQVLGAESIHIEFSILDKNPKIANYFRKKGLAVYAYTLNSENEIYRAHQMRLDGFFTDNPYLARKTLKKIMVR